MSSNLQYVTLENKKILDIVETPPNKLKYITAKTFYNMISGRRLLLDNANKILEIDKAKRTLETKTVPIKIKETESIIYNKKVDELISIINNSDINVNRKKEILGELEKYFVKSQVMDPKYFVYDINSRKKLKYPTIFLEDKVLLDASSEGNYLFQSFSVIKENSKDFFTLIYISINNDFQLRDIQVRENTLNKFIIDSWLKKAQIAYEKGHYISAKVNLTIAQECMIDTILAEGFKKLYTQLEIDINNRIEFPYKFQLGFRKVTIENITPIYYTDTEKFGYVIHYYTNLSKAKNRDVITKEAISMHNYLVENIGIDKIDVYAYYNYPNSSETLKLEEDEKSTIIIDELP